jgi:hypothetical protein
VLSLRRRALEPKMSSGTLAIRNGG